MRIYLPDLVKTIAEKMKWSLLVMTFTTGMVTSVVAQKVAISSGNYSNPAIWNPAGVPGPGDPITIRTGVAVNLDTTVTSGNLIIETGGKFTLANAKKLTVSGSVTINGLLDVNEGDIKLNQPAAFNIGATGTLIWAPYDNTANGATLFTNGTEDFNPTSTLVINKWYNYSSTPLGSVVTGNFGNVTLSTNLNGLIFEWNQQNYFEKNQIKGTLTINQGWIVLDKSGQIKNTIIGGIELVNLNSYLDFHSGNHGGTFTVNTNYIKNTGGTLNGLLNGNGNIKLEVNTDITNQGNICLIYNSGVANTSNGNATLKLLGKFTQTHGDFRGIFNITTTNSGVTDLEFGTIDLKGGIFIAHYGCHVASQTSKIKVTGNMNLNFRNPNGKFRGNGLSTLSGVQNNLRQSITVNGDLLISGNATTEFISSGSKGLETFNVKGNTVIKSGNVYFNYGSHATELLFEKSLVVENGNVTLSKTEGSLSGFINSNLEIRGGIVNIKEAQGNANLNILGNFIQTGGTLFFHNNTAVATSNVIYTTVYGDFSNDSGTIMFENNVQSTANHKLSLNGGNYTLSGAAVINAASESNVTPFGHIYFDYPGETIYTINGTTASIQNVKQIISSGCTLAVKNSNIQAASTTTPVNDLIRVANRGIIDLGNNRIVSNGVRPHSGVHVEDNGRIRTSAPAGLYDGTPDGAISAAANMQYTLHPGSIIEYYGASNQFVTGIGSGTAQGPNQQYGILEINKSAGKARLKSSEVSVRTALILPRGELDLNGFNLNILSGKPNAIVRTAGYIKSESENLTAGGQVRWKNIEQGYHSIPFGLNAQKYIPVTFTPSTGNGMEFIVSTKQCARDNRPLPTGITNLNQNSKDQGTDKIIDRYFYIKADGVNASVSLSYLPEENTTLTEVAKENFSGMVWRESKWIVVGGTGDGSVTQPGKVTINNTGEWGYYLLIANELPKWADILTFSAELDKKQVNVKWVAKANITAEKYLVQRSSDNIKFETIYEKATMPNSSISTNFSYVDYQPISGVSYYRLQQLCVDGTIKYSQTEIIRTESSLTETVEIVSVGPNPFIDEFVLTYNLTQPATVEIKMVALNGQIIFQQSIQSDYGVNRFTYSADRKLSPGLYMLYITDGKKISSVKLFNK